MSSLSHLITGTKRRAVQSLKLAQSRFNELTGPKESRDIPPAGRALQWVRNNELSTGGIRTRSGSAIGYPEVTGYLVPTMLQYGERDLAIRFARWLCCIQRADGSFTDQEGVSYIFDSGQVLRGLLAIGELVPESLDAAGRVADYLCAQMVDEGKRGFGDRYNGTIPEAVHLYVLPPLVEAAGILRNPVYKVAAERCLDFYCQHESALQINDLTHFLAYELEALIDLNRGEIAESIMNRLRARQSIDGAVPGVGDASWVCSPGLAQLAICWYKLGQAEQGDKALAWLESRQCPSGGFLGSYGAGANYFPKAELPWAAKFYLDAHLLRVKAFFDSHVAIIRSEVDMNDGRTQAILSMIKPEDRVVEVGCGKGRFLKAVKAAFPDSSCTGVDISPALLSHLPENINGLTGSLESIPVPGDSFDIAFSVEAIEHSINPAAAIAEMLRVVKPNGWVVVIDKQLSQTGRLQPLSWERWPDVDYLSRLLNRECDKVSAENVGYDGKPAEDGLMVAWRGQKRSRLSGSEWNEVLLSDVDRKKVLDDVRHNCLSEWGQEIHSLTASGQKVLEIGSGTGAISLQLALAGREISVLDISEDSLQFTRSCADNLGVSIQTTLSDAMQPLPFADDTFDCTWSSGLLEHFMARERQAMLREQSRVTRGKVVCLVPNAASLAYRMGKSWLEERGQWLYGIEMPLLSLREEFEAAGMKVLSEYSIAAKHSVRFLPRAHPMREAVTNWMESLSLKELQSCNQGYLLVTVGVKNHSSR